MRLPESFFTEHTLGYIEELLNSAREHHADLDSMPPSLSIVTDFELSHSELSLQCTLPIGLEGGPNDWEESIRQGLDAVDSHLGLMFWLFVQKPNEEGSKYLFRLVKQRGENPKGFVSDLNFNNLEEVDPLEVIPTFSFLSEL